MVAVTLVLVGYAGWLWRLPVVHHGPPGQVPWWGVALLCLGCELVVVNIRLRREANSISLGELGIVIGLFLAAPGPFVLGRMVGATSAFVLRRRQTPIKVLFNTALCLAESMTTVLVFHLVRGDSHAIAPRGWAAAAAATAAAGVLTAVFVTVVIALVEGEWRPRELLVEPVRGALSSIGTTCVALVAVHALEAEPLSAIPLGVSMVLLLLGYRAYSGLSERHVSLERLYRFSNVVTSTPEVDQILLGVLQHARDVLRADHAEVVFVSAEPGEAPIRIRATPEGTLLRERLPATEADDPVWGRVIAGGRPMILARGTRDPGMRAFLASRQVPDALVAPLRGDAGIVGTIMVGRRFGEVRTFDSEDLRLLETVANHAGMALQNGQLVHRLRHDALHDALTGLPNRAMLNQSLAEAVEDVRSRHSPGVAVMIMDLVGLKQVNDTLGHQLGDQLLREVAVRLAAQLGTDGTVARLGGDEFAILLPDVADVQQAVAVARRLQTTLEHPVRIEGLDVEVGVTIGLCLAPQHGLDGLTLIRRADAAMYEAKHTGSGLHVFESGLDSAADPERLALLGELRLGIQAGELELHVQPKASLRSGEVVGVEALVRWRHPRHGLLFPDEFIPLAERSGLIRPLTTAVMEQALTACGQWWRAGRRLTVAVNLSARSILDADLSRNIQRLLEAHQVPPSALTLEITESSIISNPARVIAVLERLHELGIRLSIDDFGTGYSSLSYLRQLPVQEVKVDKSFVMTMQEQASDATIVRSIVDLAGHLGLTVVAEGVEDAATWADLEAMGCDVVQGYYLARPMPLPDLETWLARREVTVSGARA